MKVRRIDYSADEFLVGTRGLSDAECGVYWRACSLIYSHGGPIPVDELRRWCSSRKNDFDAIVKRLVDGGKLTRNQHELGQTRAQRELERATKRAEKWRENGANGGRPVKENNAIEEPSGLSKNNRASNDQLPTINHQSKDKPLRGSSRAVARDTAEQMLSIWREECGDALGLPTKASDSRITQCSARLRNELEGDLENWRAACRRIRRSGFLTEKWKATIDWALQPKNLLKVLEGNYDDQRGKSDAEVSNRPSPKPVNPKILGHGNECMCSNCERWVAQMSEAAE